MHEECLKVQEKHLENNVEEFFLYDILLGHSSSEKCSYSILMHRIKCKKISFFIADPGKDSGCFINKVVIH